MRARTENDITSWVKFFLRGVILTAENGVTTFSDILAVERENEAKAQTLGVRSANALKVLCELYRNPLTDAQKITSVTGISTPSAYKLIEEMQRIGLLHEVTGAKRGKVYILKNYFDIFNRPITYNK